MPGGISAHLTQPTLSVGDMDRSSGPWETLKRVNWRPEFGDVKLQCSGNRGCSRPVMLCFGGFRGGRGWWVADRLFVDLTADGRVSVGTWLEGELPGGA